MRELIQKSKVFYAEKVVDITKIEQENIAETQTKFEILSDAVVESISQIESIKNMSDTLKQVKERLISATSDLGAISEELGASAEEVSATCSTVATACSSEKRDCIKMKKFPID